MLHELWVDAEGLETFCLAGPLGDAARAQLVQPARLVWKIEAASHLEAMTLYYEHKGWGPIVTAFPGEDATPYRDRGSE